jgi:hypothetical protein
VSELVAGDAFDEYGDEVADGPAVETVVDGADLLIDLRGGETAGERPGKAVGHLVEGVPFTKCVGAHEVLRSRD